MVEDDDSRQGHGYKRRATDELEKDQRLAKRFDLLNLTNDSKLYVPVSASAYDKPSTLSNKDYELMQVENTKDKVYIHDLDQELAESESDDERPIFIPDIERHLLARIPRHILVGDDAREAAKNMQMILYQAPTLLTVSPDKDKMRSAIIESRKRARERQAFAVPPASEPLLSNTTNGTRQETGIWKTEPEMVEEDLDAMDMD